jgi:glycosyltransferase involved in cell wall biosynthesis
MCLADYFGELFFVIKFSIIIPSLNQVFFLEHCLKNILHQNYSNFEIILIDGGSTDGTINLIEKLLSLVILMLLHMSMMSGHISNY